MSSKILAICDSEETYAELLTKQLLRIPGNRMEIRKFTDLDKLAQFSKTKMITHLLLSEKYKERKGEIDSLSCYYLTDQKDGCERKIKDGPKEEYIFRYQSVYHIYERISGQMVMDEMDEIHTPKEHQFEFIGLYSPLRRNGQTSSAKAIAKALGKRGRKVLYINMDEISEGVDKLRDLEENVDGEGNLGDLIYYVRRNPEKVLEELSKIMYKGKTYDTIAPIEVFTEMGKISKDEWIELMNILKRTEYDSIILDMDSHVDGYLEILEKCNKVYSISMISLEKNEKERNFHNALKVLGRNTLLINMETIEVPVYHEEILEQIETYMVQHLRLE